MWKRRIEENREFLFSCIFGNDCINDGFGEKVHSWTLRNNWEHLVDGSMQINEYIYIYKILLVIKIKNYNRDVLLTKKKKIDITRIELIKGKHAMENLCVLKMIT